jgi:hypothetical protein
MKFGLRIPSLKKRVAARTTAKRFVRHSLGLKAPRGWGWLTDPKRALCDRICDAPYAAAHPLAGSL